MLGHASAAMTLDICAELFDDDLDAVAARLNAQMPLVALPAGPQTRYRRRQLPPRADCSVFRRGSIRRICAISRCWDVKPSPLKGLVLLIADSKAGKNAFWDA